MFIEPVRIVHFASVLALLSGALLMAQLADRKALTIEGVKKMAAAAEAEAKKNNWNVVIVIVDGGGHLMYLERMDGAPVGEAAPGP